MISVDSVILLAPLTRAHNRAKNMNGSYNIYPLYGARTDKTISLIDKCNLCSAVAACNHFGFGHHCGCSLPVSFRAGTSATTMFTLVIYCSLLKSCLIMQCFQSVWIKMAWLSNILSSFWNYPVALHGLINNHLCPINAHIALLDIHATTKIRGQNMQKYMQKKKDATLFHTSYHWSRYTLFKNSCI